MTCAAGHADCGHPRTKRGPPPRGWVHVKVVRSTGAWFCSPECAWASLTSSPPPARRTSPAGPMTERHDVANCPTCINRHDRGHRCPICNTAPQLLAPRPTPAAGPALVHDQTTTPTQEGTR